MPLQERRKAPRPGDDPGAESSTPRRRRSDVGTPAPDGGRAFDGSGKADHLGLSDLDIERLRSGRPGPIYPRSDPDTEHTPHHGEDRIGQLLRGQSELLELCTSGAGRKALLEHTVVLAQRVLAPARCSIRLVDTCAGAGAPRQAGGKGAVPESEDSTGACWSHPILAPDGKLQGTISIYRDVPGGPNAEDRRVLDIVATMARFVIQTARREEALHSANERFASLAASIPGVVYQRRVTPEGDIAYTYISEGARDIFGVTAEEIVADPRALFDCHGPEYRETFRERLLEASRKLEMWDVEAQIVTADGEEKWTHAIARPHRERDGSVLWDGVILDATRIKRAEFDLRAAKEVAEAANRTQAVLLEKLRGAKERFASLAASIPGVVYQRRVTPEGDIAYTYISEGARDIFGVTAEEIMADPRALFDCHGPEYRETFRERLLEASRKLEMWDVEAQIVTADGEEKWTHAIARPHRDRDGSVLWDGVILDATRIKRAEFDLRAAKEAAEAANRAKTLFLAQVGHELRTPLNAVIGFAQILEQQHLGPLGHAKYEDYARHIEKSGCHLLKVINSILEFTKLETGKAAINEKRINIAEALDNVMGKFRAAAEAKSMEVTMNIGKDVPLVMGDEEKLDYIFQTLISNAVKFTPDGGSVRVEGGRDEDGNVVIEVIDTGIGIAAEDIPKVFQPFAQIDDELSRKYEGIGLGVSLAVAMAEMHGGSIGVDSELGLGTEVRLTLPKSRALA